MKLLEKFDLTADCLLAMGALRRRIFGKFDLDVIILNKNCTLDFAV